MFWKLLLYILIPSSRVLEQHKLTKEQWEDRIRVWHEQHKRMIRYNPYDPFIKLKTTSQLCPEPKTGCLSIVSTGLSLQRGCNDRILEDFPGSGDVWSELFQHQKQKRIGVVVGCWCFGTQHIWTFRQVYHLYFIFNPCYKYKCFVVNSLQWTVLDNIAVFLTGWHLRLDFLGVRYGIFLSMTRNLSLSP